MNPRTKKRPKGHKITKSQKGTQDPEKDKRATNSIFIKSHHRKGQDPKAMVRPKKDSDHILRHFQGYWGQDTLEEFFQDNSSQGKEGPNIRRAQWHSFWDRTQVNAPKGRID
ncbi:hypothetical protein O181_079384 [Austropuccinia psidii MF-1]|uniref:Uncharacterized protein n=1 Tax=Austropuccinia psidii MF-1 TaxID=1389203 RepID=A0A9Q3FID6_9BASI|nr:hypothetical protein [Austropuccinia psidii MF-1]